MVGTRSRYKLATICIEITTRKIERQFPSFCEGCRKKNIAINGIEDGKV